MLIATLIATLLKYTAIYFLKFYVHQIDFTFFENPHYGNDNSFKNTKLSSKSISITEKHSSS